MYAPIVGAADSYHGHQPVETPETTMGRTVKLQEEYAELKKDLMEEVNMVDDKMIKPAMDAKDSLALMKKTIKKREDRKVKIAN
jgi:amphiphysin